MDFERQNKILGGLIKIAHGLILMGDANEENVISILKEFLKGKGFSDSIVNEFECDVLESVKSKIIERIAHKRPNKIPPGKAT